MRLTPRPSLPGRTWPSGPYGKHAVLNHWLYRWAAFDFGSHVISGRGLAALGPSSPRAAGSTRVAVAVAGRPVMKRVMPEISQPFATAPTKPRLLRANGSV